MRTSIIVTISFRCENRDRRIILIAIDLEGKVPQKMSSIELNKFTNWLEEHTHPYLPLAIAIAQAANFHLELLPMRSHVTDPTLCYISWTFCALQFMILPRDHHKKKSTGITVAFFESSAEATTLRWIIQRSLAIVTVSYPKIAQDHDFSREIVRARDQSQLWVQLEKIIKCWSFYDAKVRKSHLPGNHRLKKIVKFCDWNQLNFA